MFPSTWVRKRCLLQSDSINTIFHPDKNQEYPEKYSATCKLKQTELVSATCFAKSISRDLCPNNQVIKAKKRVKRGLFSSSQGILVNADCNGSGTKNPHTF